MTLRALLVAAFLLTAAACTRSRIILGSPVQPSEAASIVPGLSKAGVLAQIGPPDRVQMEVGGSAFEYLYSREAARNLDVSIFQGSFSYSEARLKVDRLLVSFDASGTVRYVSIIPADEEESQ